MTEKLSHQLRGLAINSAPSHIDSIPSSSHNNNAMLPTKSSASGSRPPVQMKKFMNPIPQRQQNPYAESGKSAMMRLAGVPNPERVPLGSSNAANPSGTGSPARAHVKGVHTAHGVHGPAHSSTGRLLTSTLGPQKKVPTASSTLAGASVKDGKDFGKYDIGVNRDENTPIGGTTTSGTAQRIERAEALPKHHPQGLRDEGVAIRVNEGLDMSKLPEGDIGSMMNKK
jgi:aurora kinase